MVKNKQRVGVLNVLHHAVEVLIAVQEEGVPHARVGGLSGGIEDDAVLIQLMVQELRPCIRVIVVAVGEVGIRIVAPVFFQRIDGHGGVSAAAGGTVAHFNGDAGVPHQLRHFASVRANGVGHHFIIVFSVKVLILNGINDGVGDVVVGIFEVINRLVVDVSAAIYGVAVVVQETGHGGGHTAGRGVILVVAASVREGILHRTVVVVVGSLVPLGGGERTYRSCEVGLAGGLRMEQIVPLFLSNGIGTAASCCGLCFVFVHQIVGDRGIEVVL